MNKKFVLTITPVSNEQQLKNFDCGNKSINNMIHTSYYPQLLHQSSIYQLCVNGICVGYYRTSISCISCENTDAEWGDFYSDSTVYTAMMIDCIAVDKTIQKCGYGTKLLLRAIAQARAMYDLCPIRLVLLEALSEKVDWYTKHGFKFVQKNDKAEQQESILMYLDLMPNSEKLICEEYISQEV